MQKFLQLNKSFRKTTIVDTLYDILTLGQFKWILVGHFCKHFV